MGKIIIRIKINKTVKRNNITHSYFLIMTKISTKSDSSCTNLHKNQIYIYSAKFWRVLIMDALQ